jgi:hypothetical protein
MKRVLVLLSSLLVMLFGLLNPSVGYASQTPYYIPTSWYWGQSGLNKFPTNVYSPGSTVWSTSQGNTIVVYGNLGQRVQIPSSRVVHLEYKVLTNANTNTCYIWLGDSVTRKTSNGFINPIVDNKAHLVDLVLTPSDYNGGFTSFDSLVMYFVGPSGSTYANVSLLGASVDLPPVPTPTGLKVTGVTSSTVSLAWDPVSGATSYNVYMDGAVKKSGLTNTSTTVSGIAPGSTHNFQVTAVNVGESDLSQPVSATTPLDAPTNLKASNVQPTSFTLTWDALPGAASYEVFKDRVKVATVTSPTYNFIGLSPVSNDVYTVRGVSSGGTPGPMSQDLWVQTPDLPVTPSPTNVHSNGPMGGNGTITWSPGPNTPPGTVYSVYQSGQLLGTTTNTTFPLTNYNPNFPYAVSAQAPGWKPSPMVSDSPLELAHGQWGFDALDLLNNSVALVASLGGILLLVLTFMFAPSLVRFVRSIFKRHREDETLVYEPVQYRTDDDYTARYSYAGSAAVYRDIDYAGTTTDTTADLETDVHPRIQRAPEDYSTSPSRLDTHVSTEVSSRPTTDRVRSDIGTYRFDY